MMMIEVEAGELQLGVGKNLLDAGDLGVGLGSDDGPRYWGNGEGRLELLENALQMACDYQPSSKFSLHPQPTAPLKALLTLQKNLALTSHFQSNASTTPRRSSRQIRSKSNPNPLIISSSRPIGIIRKTRANRTSRQPQHLALSSLPFLKNSSRPTFSGTDIVKKASLLVQLERTTTQVPSGRPELLLFLALASDSGFLSSGSQTTSHHHHHHQNVNIGTHFGHPSPLTPFRAAYRDRKWSDDAVE
ncbi:hypothetical protein K435DRAFT_973040 [Dendrothele bispora CBS 962.96]|uniref:Uncharacterized protein n=1 Tax=Dendrothele bispora (strain CBS 962.96) TaxID=1314807 RepID=A0A4S8KUZ5_DENBC|nr:hypothetical protein K435DRAFT_973040 [Dendrothele bispora CBS 962.96]